MRKRWRWIVAAAVVLYVFAVSPTQDSAAGAALSCTMRVTVDALNVRSGPDSRDPVVETLAEGAVVSADLTTRNGYRQLGPDRWAAQLYLVSAPGSTCGAPVR